MLRSRPRGDGLLKATQEIVLKKNEERKEVPKILRGPFIENEEHKPKIFFFLFNFQIIGHRP